MDGGKEPILGLGLYRRGRIVRLVGRCGDCQAFVEAEEDGGYVE